MPAFKSHRRFNYLVFILIVIVLHWAHRFDLWIMATISIGVVVGTELITPDLDTNSVPYRRMKPIWYPYRKLWKHRKSSHEILLGFIGRLLYAFLIISLVSLLFVNFETYISTLTYIVAPGRFGIFIGIVSGIAIANALHIFLDKIT